MIRFAALYCCLFLLSSWSYIAGQSLSLSGSGYDMHAELNWTAVPGADSYRIWTRSDGEDAFSLLATTAKLRRMHWTGRNEGEIARIQYVVEALSITQVVLATSDTIEVTIQELSDDAFLDMVQEYTFRYFYDYAHPVSGMARERLGSGDIVTAGGSGFGILAIITGIHRGFITREQGVDHLLKMVSFLQFADRFHGVYPHWMHGTTGDVIPFSTFDNGGDLVETAFLFQGLLCARQYFDRNTPKENALRSVITNLWESVEWDHYARNNSGVLYWHWSPQHQWQLNLPVRGYNEAMMVYLLAISSPTHSVPASYWHTGWAGGQYVNGLTWYGHRLFVGPPLGGPLFFAHYSFMGFDPRNKKDDYANYFEQNRNHTLINRAWCTANPLHHTGYHENCWGLTASDNPWGYLAHAPGATTDNGTITPAAAIPSMPYTPAESMAAMKFMYRNYGDRLWGEYGFYDAFNPGQDWVANSWLAIDQGPIINMIENYRSGLLWNLFMDIPEINPALEAIGFVEDITHVSSEGVLSGWKVFPTIHDGVFHIQADEHTDLSTLRIQIVHASGVALPFSTTTFDDRTIRISLSDAPAGWMIINIEQNGRTGSLISVKGK